MFVFETLLQLRNNTIKAVSHLKTEQLNTIQHGHSNNIIWHIGHMLASQQILCYVKSGVQPRITEEMIRSFQKGSSPKDWNRTIPLKEIKPLFIETAELFFSDYKKGTFNNYEKYTTSAGVTLNNIDEAILYSYGHENLHFGNITTLLKHYNTTL